MLFLYNLDGHGENNNDLCNIQWETYHKNNTKMYNNYVLSNESR